jgi:hypothetical protein
MTSNTEFRKLTDDDLNDDELNLVSGGLLLFGETLSNVSKTRSEISMTFARNSHA